MDARAGIFCRMLHTDPPVGTLLRAWRERRGMTQMVLALQARISPRHLSFVETGRSQPSRELLLRLSEELEVPLRERNALFVSGGFAPMYRERALQDEALRAAREAIDLVLEAHRPFPAFALDRHWNIVASNGALPQLYAGVAETLMRPPVNALRITLHPEGFAPRIANLAQWRGHLLARLRREIDSSADPVLTELMREVSGYPVPGEDARLPVTAEHAIAVPFNIRTPAGLLSFYSTTTIFGRPADVTLSEIAIESFFPADVATAEAVRRLA